jgi:hypothetical protein
MPLRKGSSRETILKNQLNEKTKKAAKLGFKL